MTWFYATSVSVTNGATVVSVNAGDDIALAQGAGGLVIGTQPPVEIKRTYVDGGSNKKIELLKPWPYGSQTNQAAVAFPTDGDLAAATAVLKQLIDGFTLATQAEAQAGTENTKPMTALRVKQAMDALLGTASKLTATTSRTDPALGRALKTGDSGVGVALEGINIRSLPITAFFTGSSGIQVTGAPDNGFGFGIKMSHTSQGQNYYASIYRAHDAEKWYVTGTYGQGDQPWCEVYHSGSILGAVAFSGGRNTGAIIERGVNSNGEYAKFADGTVFAWNTFELSGLSINPAKSGFSETAIRVDPALPVSMINGVVSIGSCEFRTSAGLVVHTIQGRDLQGRSIFLNLGTAPSLTWPRLDVIGSEVITNATISWSAVGRWR